MNLLQNLMRQHRDLLEIFSDIRESLQGDVSFGNEDFRKDLSFLEGKLKIHLTMEDKHLYPLLSKEEGEEIGGAAEEYRKEMVQLFDVFHAFMVRLREGSQEMDEDRLMKEELFRILDRISSRISFEEDTLWPLLRKKGYE